MKISIKIAILFAAVMLFLAPTAVTMFAKPSDPSIGKDRGYARPFVGHILIGHDFAIQGYQYRILDMNAITNE